MGGKGVNDSISLKLCGGLHPKCNFWLVIWKKKIRTTAVIVPPIALPGLSSSSVPCDTTNEAHSRAHQPSWQHPCLWRPISERADYAKEGTTRLKGKGGVLWWSSRAPEGTAACGGPMLEHRARMRRSSREELRCADPSLLCGSWPRWRGGL